MLSMAVANHVLWPLAKFVNAKLVPKQHQSVANKVVQVCMSLLLCLLVFIRSKMIQESYNQARLGYDLLVIISIIS